VLARYDALPTSCRFNRRIAACAAMTSFAAVRRTLTPAKIAMVGGKCASPTAVLVVEVYIERTVTKGSAQLINLSSPGDDSSIVPT